METATDVQELGLQRRILSRLDTELERLLRTGDLKDAMEVGQLANLRASAMGRIAKLVASPRLKEAPQPKENKGPSLLAFLVAHHGPISTPDIKVKWEGYLGMSSSALMYALGQLSLEGKIIRTEKVSGYGKTYYWQAVKAGAK